MEEKTCIVTIDAGRGSFPNDIQVETCYDDSMTDDEIIECAMESLLMIKHNDCAIIKIQKE